MNKNVKFGFSIVISLFIGCQSGPFIQVNKSHLWQTTNSSRKKALTWIANNVKPNGLFYYKYNPIKRKHSSKNNALRQLMASRLLAEFSFKDQSFLELHKRNLNFIFKHWYREKENRGYIYYSKKSKLGANAMALRTLVASPLFSQYQKQAEKIKNGILACIKDDYTFKAWLIEPHYPYDEKRLLNFYSGEALLSLVEYYQATKDQTLLKTILKVQKAYIKLYVDDITKNYYPAYVPWHTLSLNKLYKITKDPLFVKAIFTLNDRLLTMQDTKKRVGRFYNPKTPEYGTPHSSSDAVYTEGLAYAFEIAAMVQDTKRQRQYYRAIRMGVHNLLSLQYLDTPDPKLYGSFRYSIKKWGIRVDTTQHAIDGFTKILSVID